MASATALSVDRLTLLDPPPALPLRRRWQTLAGLVAALLVAAAAAGWLVQAATAERRQVLVSAAAARLEALAHGRAEVLETWLDGVEAQGRRITRSELVQLFALELALADPQASLPQALDEQLPYMRQLMDEMARQGELVGSYLVSTDGRLLLADSAAPAMTRAQLAATADAALGAGSDDAGARAGRRIATLPDEGGGVRLDLVLPIPAPQPDFAARSLPGAVLVMRIAAGDRLEQVLRPGPLDLPGESAGIRLADGSLLESAGAGPAIEAGPAAFRGVAVLPELGWRVEQSADEAEVLRPLVEFRRSLALGALAALLLLGLAGGWICWRLSSRHQAELLAQYRDFAGRLRQQHDLLHGIMSAIPDLVGLKTGRGGYAFANPAMATALATPVAQIVGRTDAELFPAAVATALGRLDADAAAIGIARRDELEVSLCGRRRHLNVVVAPLADEAEAVVGTVMVARDVSELVARRRERERLVQQTISALARTIELADPYLCGHSQRMALLSSRIAVELGLDDDTVATVRTASTLSQIGKLFVPRELLAKPGRHDEAEQAAMRRHVDHAQAVLRDVELGLPVAAALGQMHERLDGTGYPHGLAGPAIGQPARVLAVADVFCARTAPRSYRDAAEPATVLGHLRAHPDRYDGGVVAALAAVLAQGPAADRA
ncbi:MAG TPA: HD domain-containing phosphohydrolase [Geminicoccaceae bacterium]|nr:HD domain-containing phosphohydrolase [Geminicoccus sp.]HMU49160.1 HD domain-containing phosphohydrolase [Geminicoccaceae bacterium]